MERGSHTTMGSNLKLSAIVALSLWHIKIPLSITA